MFKFIFGNRKLEIRIKELEDKLNKLQSRIVQESEDKVLEKENTLSYEEKMMRIDEAAENLANELSRIDVYPFVPIYINPVTYLQGFSSALNDHFKKLKQHEKS